MISFFYRFICPARTTAIALQVCVAVSGLTSCRDTSVSTSSPKDAKETTLTAGTIKAAGARCPQTDIHHDPFSSVRPEHRQPAYWLSRWTDTELDQSLLSEAQIDRQNQAVGQSGRAPVTLWNLLPPAPTAKITEDSRERFAVISSKLKRKELVTARGTPMPAHLQAIISLEAGRLRSDNQHAIWHVALTPTQIRCVPFDGPLFQSDSDRTFDKNACSTIQPQEPFEVLGQWKNRMLFIRTRYSFGFISPSARRSGDVKMAYRATYMNAPTVRTLNPLTVHCNDEEIQIPQYSMLPMVSKHGKHSVLVAGKAGICEHSLPDDSIATRRPLTRRAFYETAFQYLDAAYGYGGSKNGMDCSRYIMNVLSAFHLFLPRNSASQSQAGSFSIDVSEVTDLEQKLGYVTLAAKQGIVALYFPGHIMFYLGKTADGVPMAIHSLGEYAKPCDPLSPNAGETVFRVKKVVVTDLSVGLGSSRRSFLERITRIVVFGENAGKRLRAIATHRAAAPPRLPTTQCTDSVQMRIFQSPRRLISGETARLIATGRAPLDRDTMQIYAPDGTAIPSSVFRLNGPPNTLWTRFTPSTTGKYKVVLGDGENVHACDEFVVRRYREKETPRAEPAPYWQTRWKWESDTENLYAAFVEQLFDFPPEQEISWNGLQSLLGDPDRNILFNYMGQNEDAKLNLTPDCADLPYFLRAYFSWKTGLPFGVRSCSRGRTGRPPSCTDFQTNDQTAPFEESLDSEEKIFERFANVVIGWNAHSASGRTHPRFNDTDFYPVALQRNALTPGSIFADPYGHIMIVSKWIPQPPGGYGILMAVDGQPDGTIGRRRFWKGDFLFDSDTRSYGSGFKKFRPITVETQTLEDETVRIPRTLTNSELKKSRIFSRYSLSQYEEGVDTFYARMQQLINPMPLNPEKLLQSRVDALFEAVKRRIQAIDNGEAYMAQHANNPIEMPEGHEIFQTEGPWENFATPSRDMRLLIAIKAVTTTPDMVRQYPKQFGISKSSEITRVVSHLNSLLETTLEAKTVMYTRSNRSRWRLTLFDIVNRADALEMGYNPNDCPEYRWGATRNSKEFATCIRRAPEEQHVRMNNYRSWFHSRKRPVRE